MKKTASIALHIPVLSVTLFALSSLALAQHTMQPAGQESQSNLVQIVREATKQYLDINNAIAAGMDRSLAVSAAPTMVRWVSITSIPVCSTERLTPRTRRL